MRRVICEQCQQEVARKDAVQVLDRVLCLSCATAFIQQMEHLPEDSVTRLTDPTVCFRCSADAGEKEWPMIAGLPVCEACEATLRNYPFPTWVKLALALVLAMTIVGLVRNFRFFQGFIAMKQAQRLFAVGKLDQAASTMALASARVPESQELRYMLKTMQGLQLASQERFEEAADAFREAVAIDPNDSVASHLLLRCEAAAAFLRQDYDVMIARWEALYSELQDKDTRLGLAGAYACKYAQTGEEPWLAKSRELVQEAKNSDELTEEDRFEVQRIEHRLSTREILKREEFKQRFPQGWQPQEEQP